MELFNLHLLWTQFLEGPLSVVSDPRGKIGRRHEYRNIRGTKPPETPLSENAAIAADAAIAERFLRQQVVPRCNI